MTLLAPADAPAPANPISTAPRRRTAWIRRPALMCVALFVAYLGLSFVVDTRAFLVSDVGSKVATVRSMDARGDLDPDVGYWAAAYDPDGVLHPFENTVHFEDRWVNVTTLPMLFAGVPLYAVGGARALLLLPMLGAVMVALGARALARRLDGPGDAAFWLVGLATPVALYALDFWEHAPGLACMVWAVVLLSDVALGVGGGRAALGGGLLFGAAATMRTEALVYTAVACAVFGIAAWARRARPPWRDGTLVVAGVAVVLAANRVLEQWAFGSGLRASRTADTAGLAGSDASVRAKDALITAVGLNRWSYPTDWVFGAVIVLALAIAAWAFARPGRSAARLAWVALGFATYGYLVWLLQGLGFLPGALTASPLAVVGLVYAWRPGRARLLGIVAVLAPPAVWLVQYSGGTAAIWGARYLLCSATLLAVLGVVALGRLPRPAAVGLALLAVLVTASGMAWMSVRTHAFADALADVTASDAPLVVAQAPQLLREAGGFYEPGDRWLTVRDGSSVADAADVVAESGADRFTLVTLDRRSAPTRLGDFTRLDRRTVPLTAGVDLVATRYRRSGA